MGRHATGCLPTNPARGSVYLAGRAVNLTAISRVTGISKSFLCRVLSGNKDCRVLTYRKIAASIGMGLEELLNAIDTRRMELAESRVQIVEQYKARVNEEDHQDRVAIQKGKIVKPRLPGLRLS